MQLRFSGGWIRTWRMEDAPALAANANNREVWLRLRDRMPHPYLIEDARTYIDRVLASEAELSFCIEVNGKAGGAIGLRLGSDIHRGTAEIGYWLGESFWGRGVMTNAVAAFVAHAFATFPLERIFAESFANNPASARVLEKAGFQLEGRLRRNVIKDGEVLDSLLYARLRDSEAANS